MKIKDVKASVLSFSNRKVVSSTSWREMTRVLVEVESDEGLTGIGESFQALSHHAVVALVERGLKRHVISESPFDVERLVSKMMESSTYVGGVGVTRHAIAGIEIALWDLVGKSVGLPVYQLLGGAYSQKIKAYASLPRIDSTDDVEKYAAYCVRQGFKAIKLHQRDEGSLSATRAAVGDDVEIMVDVNSPWSRREALAFARCCEEHDVRWLEEPIHPHDDLEGLAQLRSSTTVPIATGENESTLRGFRVIMESEAADVIQPSITKIGGLLIGKKICVLAEAHNVEVAPHSWTLPIGVMASIHLALSSPSCTYVEVPPELEESPLREPIEIKDGYLCAQESPGLGIRLDEEAVARHRLSS